MKGGSKRAGEEAGRAERVGELLKSAEVVGGEDLEEAMGADSFSEAREDLEKSERFLRGEIDFASGRRR